MSDQLIGKTVALLATDGFEQSELFTPLEELRKAGAKVDIISLKGESIKGWNEKNWGKSIQVDHLVADVSVDQYDALMLPGGVMNPDSLRKDEKAVAFVKSFFEAGKPVSAICHAPSLLIETDYLKDRTLTSYPSIKTDLINAGAKWVDEEVVCDDGLVTSRNPNDLPAFCQKMIEEIQEGSHQINLSAEGFAAIL